MTFIPQWADESLGKPKKQLFSPEDIAAVREITQITPQINEIPVELILSEPIMKKIEQVIYTDNSENALSRHIEGKREKITLKGRKNGKRS
jgi:hypothetical protein